MLVFSELNIERRWLSAGLELVRLDHARRAEIEAAVCCRATAKKLVAMDLPKLRWVQLTSAGYDGVPLAEFARKGISVANAGGVYGVPIAETVVFGMLQMAKKYRRNPNNRRVKYTRGYRCIGELAGKTVLILGAGQIGTEVARRLAGFQMTILGYDVFSGQKDGFARIVNDKVEVQAVLNECDFVVCTLPDAEDTRGLIDAEWFGGMKPSCVFVNVGRRAVVNETDLYRALKSKAIGGAVLDMFEWLPNPLTNRFRRLASVIVLPGVAAISREANERLQRLVSQNLARVMAHEPPSCIVAG
jgi:phosphoglycerate dehydrogenase-like enzyme